MRQAGDLEDAPRLRLRSAHDQGATRALELLVGPHDHADTLRVHEVDTSQVEHHLWVSAPDDDAERFRQLRRGGHVDVTSGADDVVVVGGEGRFRHSLG